MTLKDLIRSLDEFYDTETAKNWLDAHPVQDAVPDDADNVWMAKQVTRWKRCLAPDATQIVENVQLYRPL